MKLEKKEFEDIKVMLKFNNLRQVYGLLPKEISFEHLKLIKVCSSYLEYKQSYQFRKGEL